MLTDMEKFSFTRFLSENNFGKNNDPISLRKKISITLKQLLKSERDEEGEGLGLGFWD